jgi:hypothetical protein
MGAAVIVGALPSASSAVAGDLDSAFGGDGKVRTPLTSHDDSVASLALQSDGKIVVVGAAAADRQKSRIALAR